MKKNRKLFVLLGVLAAAVIATIIVKGIETKKEKIKTTAAVIVSVESEDVKSLNWNYEDVSLSFHKDEDNWIFDDDEAFPVDNDKMTALLDIFNEFGASFVIEEVDDFDQYGLEKPMCTINFETDSESYEVKLGDFSTMDEQRYVSIGDGNVYLVNTDPFDSYGIELKNTIKNDEIPTFDSVSEIEFEGSENYTIYYEEDSSATYCPSDLYFTRQDGKVLPLDTYRVEDYYSNISLLSLGDYVTYNATEDELKSFGLDTPDLTVNISYTQESENEDEEDIAGTFEISFGRNVEELKAREEKEAEADENETIDEEEYPVTCYARIGDSGIVYEITESDYENMVSVSYDDLRHKEVFTADFEEVTSLEITLDGKEYTITTDTGDDSDSDKEKSDDEDEEIKYYFDGEEVDISSLETALGKVSAESFTDEKSSGKEEELKLKANLSNTNFDSVEIILYRYDGTNCLASVNGKSTCLVSRSSVVDLIESINAIVLG